MVIEERLVERSEGSYFIIFPNIIWRQLLLLLQLVVLVRTAVARLSISVILIFIYWYFKIHWYWYLRIVPENISRLISTDIFINKYNCKYQWISAVNISEWYVSGSIPVTCNALDHQRNTLQKNFMNLMRYNLCPRKYIINNNMIIRNFPIQLYHNFQFSVITHNSTAYRL